MKKTSFLLSLVLVIVAISACTGKQEELKWAPFYWDGIEMGDKYIEKAAIIVPVTIEGIPHKFNMQLDLGAIATNLYGNSFDSYLEIYPDFKSKLDSTKTFWIEGEENIMFSNVDLNIGSIPFKNINVGYFESFGDAIDKDSVYSNTEKHIGTIAPDIFQGKILIIDYPNTRLAVADSLPKQFQDASFIKYIDEDGRIMIPFQIDGKTENLVFDTGSSLFSLFTSEKQARAIASPEIVDTIVGQSWGVTQSYYGLKTVKPILLAGAPLPNSLVYFESSNSLDEFFESGEIWGLTGNAFFVNSVVIIDYKNGLFGVK